MVPISAKITFVGLNALRLVSLVVAILVFTTLIMGLVEDIRDYHNDANISYGLADDCAYVPGTNIPMQTWGIVWVELHRALIMIGVVALFLAELSWLGISSLERASQIWFPLLSRTRGLAAMGCVHVTIATSMLSHYLDEFPLVVSWMMFVVGIIYVFFGLSFHLYSLKDGRSLISHKRNRFTNGKAHGYVYRSLGKDKDVGTSTSSGKPSSALNKLFKRKNYANKVSIHESFPSLESESHKQILADRARRAEHRRKASSVAVDMSTLGPDSTSITRDFVWNATAGVIHERDPQPQQPDSSNAWELRDINDKRRDSELSDQSCSMASVASSTQIRIGGYTTYEAARAREKAKRRRTAAGAVKDDKSYPPAANSTGKSAAGRMKGVKRKSLAFVSTARNRLSAGTASALAARRKVSPARGLRNSDADIMIEYIDDGATAPPVPPLPAYHQATRTADPDHLPVASRFA